MTDKQYKYSEIFHSFQGEGAFTCRSTAWIRFFLCNLQCDGFGQKNPTDPSTYILPYKDFDVKTIDKIEDLPVWQYGCDSSYTWAKKYGHLAHNETAVEIVNQIQDVLKHSTNPEGLFVHPLTGQDHHMAFTGGEPLLKGNQQAITAIMNEFVSRGNVPKNITVETNGTQFIEEDSEFYDTLKNRYTNPKIFNWFWSISPKLWSTAGEKPEKAIVPEAVATYYKLSPRGQLKYVIDGSEASWKEVEEHTKAFRDAGVGFPVYIMYVGATKEEQEDDNIATVAMEAMKRGYHFSGRLHTHIFGNAIGT